MADCSSPMTSNTDSKAAKDCSNCEKWTSKVLKNSPMIKFMLKEMEKAGCALPPSIFKCQPCEPDRAGGFSPQMGIILCQNQLTSRQHTEDTMAHELIHAFDHCTAHVDWQNQNRNLEHVACSEIRAQMLSGECRWTREISRGNFKFAKQFQECVRRRAVLGVQQASGCKDPEMAKLAVASVWDACFRDRAPFDDIY